MAAFTRSPVCARLGLLAGCFLALTTLAACGGEDVEVPSAVTYEADGATPAGLPNYRRWSDNISSGGRPVAGVGIRNLAALGFKTLVCVEAQEPDVAEATRHGMRPAHIPLGYVRLDDAALLRIAQAVHGKGRLPAYVYCDDGTARGPLAATIARKSVEGVSMEEAAKALQDAGVPLTQAALYQAVRRFRPPTDEELDAGAHTIPQRVAPNPLAAQMGKVAARAEHLEAWADNGWDRPRTGPTLGATASEDPTAKNTAAEHARALAALFEALPEPAGDDRLRAQFRQYRDDALAASRLVVFGLARKSPDKATRALTRLKAACAQCHRVVRK